MHSLGQCNKLLGLRDSSQGGHPAFLSKGRASAAIWHDLHKSKQGSLFRHTPPPSLLGIRPPRPRSREASVLLITASGVERPDPRSYHHSRKVWPHKERIHISQNSPEGLRGNREPTSVSNGKSREWRGGRNQSSPLGGRADGLFL